MPLLPGFSGLGESDSENKALEVLDSIVMRGGRVLDKMGGVRGLLGAPAMSPWTSHP